MDFLKLTPFESEALLLSLKVSLWAVCISIVSGILAAWLLVRKNFLGKAFNAIINTCTVCQSLYGGDFKCGG